MPKKFNLVFQGGSVKGTAYVGALKALFEHIAPEDIGCVAGTSAGSLTATLIALGCSIEQVEELTCSFNFEDLLDDGEGCVNTQTKFLKSVEKTVQGYSFFNAKIPVMTKAIPIIDRILNEGGLFQGEFLRSWIDKMIRAQVSELTQGEQDGTDLTFAELHELTIKYPCVFHDLFVVGSDLSSEGKLVFSYKDLHARDAIIADVIRVSMSIPYLFKPHTITYKIHGRRMQEMGEPLWTDGGLYDNYMIDIFDNESFIGPDDEPLKNASDGRFYNPQTLGFRLVPFKEDTGELASKIKALTQGVLGAGFALQEAFYNRPENKERTIYIDHLNISTLAFNLSSEQKTNLIQSGYQCTKDALERPLGEKHGIEQTLGEKLITGIRY